MRSSVCGFVVIAMIVIAGPGACRARTAPATYDRCDRNPPDSVPPPPIALRASADAPGVVFVRAQTSESAFKIYAVLDHRGAALDSGRARFDGILPGSHMLRVRAFGFGERDTLITLPADSSLIVDVTLSRGNGMRYCSSYIVEKER